MPASPKVLSPLTPAATDLGLGDILSQQAEDEEEEKKKRLLRQQGGGMFGDAASAGLASQALGLGGLGGAR